MTDNNQDDLWNTDSSDEGFFDSPDQTPDIFGEPEKPEEAKTAAAEEPIASSEAETAEPVAEATSEAKAAPKSLATEPEAKAAPKSTAAEKPDTVEPVVPKAASPKPTAPAPEMPRKRVAAAPTAKAQADGYVVLARKYRPQTFDDIVGQEGVEQALRGAIATGQISHSYLFNGPRGTGKTSTARILAKAVNCQDNGPRPDPCGRCASCRSITVGSSLDVIEIDAASNTGVDNIRELKSGVVLAPFSRYKVYIVDEVHMLSNQAFNALLKTLEEPPPQVIFVLATTELHKVPETIISRCQTFTFRRFSMDELKKQLGTILEIEAKARDLTVGDEDREKILDLIARNAEGGMRDAQVTLDQVLVLSKGTMDFDSVRRFLGMADAEALDLFVSLLHERKSRELLELIDQLVTSGQDLELFVKGACEYMRDLMLIKCAGSDTSMIDVSDDRRSELNKIATALPARFLVESVDHLIKVVGEMKVSGQPRIVLELAVLKLALAGPPPDMESVLKRLDDLEKGQKPGTAVPAAATAPAQARSSAGSEARNDHYQAEEVSSEGAGMIRENAVTEKPVSTAPPAELAPVGDGARMVDALMGRLRENGSMLRHSLEKALCGHECNGQTLTIYLNAAHGFQCGSLLRAPNMAILNEVCQGLFGSGMQLRMESKEGVPVKAQENALTESPEPVVAQTSPAVAMTQEQPKAAMKPVQVDSDEYVDPKIYYPEEIREKTMLEVKDSEFQQLLSDDSALKELVDKTKRVFGLDDKAIKFHRSTLA